MEFLCFQKLKQGTLNQVSVCLGLHLHPVLK